MKPIRYVDELNRFYRSQGHPPYRWTINETAPLTPLKKPLSDCTVAMLTSGGISQCSAAPFDPMARNDHRLDAIPNDASSSDFQIHDSYYNHSDADEDLNCQFPIDRLREVAASKEIGRVADRFWSGFMGRIYDRTKIMEESAPAFAVELGKDEVDLLIAVPACPLDHQTAGLVCRVVEEAGIPTVCISTGRDITEQTKPPRSLFVNHPMGNAFGAPGDREMQFAILRAGLNLIVEAKKGGVLIDAPFEWPTEFEFAPGKSRV